MELDRAINSRRCIRSYIDTKITKEELKALLEAAIRAPSSCNRQPWRFIIVRNKEKIKTIYKAASYSTQNQKFILKANVCVIVCTDLRCYKSVPYSARGENVFSLQEAAAAVQNMLLKACEMDIGACWIGLFDEEFVKKEFNLNKHLRPSIIITLGHTKSKAQTTKREKLDKFIIEEID